MLLGRTWGMAAKRTLRRRRLECERLESRRVLATALLNATTLEFQALAGELNDAEIRIEGADVVMRDANNPLVAVAPVVQVDPQTVSIPLASITDVSVFADDMADWLRVNSSGELFTRPVSFFPGPADNDQLVLEGNPSLPSTARETYISLGANLGILLIDPDDNAGPGGSGAFNGDEQVVSFFGAVQITDTVPVPRFDFFASAGADLINIADNITITTLDCVPNCVAASITDGGGGTFEAIQTANKRVITVSGLDSADTVAVDFDNRPNLLERLEVYGNELSAGSINPDDNAGDRIEVAGTFAELRTVFSGQGGDDTADVHQNFSLDQILGVVEINGGAAGETNGDVLFLRDTGSVVADGTITVDGQSVQGLASATILHEAVESISLTANGLGNTIDVLGTAAGTQTNLATGGGNDTVTLGNQSADFNAGVMDGTLSAILGAISIDPQSDQGFDRLNVDDSGDPVGDVATVTDLGGFGNVTRLVGLAPANIDFSNGTGADDSFETVQLRTTAVADTITIGVLVSPEVMQIETGAGADAISVASSAATAFVINGGPPEAGTPSDTLTVVGAGGQTTLTASLLGPTSGQFVAGANRPITFTHIEGVTMSDTGGLAISGTGIDDRIRVMGSAAGAVVAGVNEQPEIGFSGVTGVTLDGFNGNDTLDASGLVNGIAATLNGNAGDDILTGGTGDDTINGNAGRDIIRGGGGTNAIDGGSEFDALVQAGTPQDDFIDVRQESNVLLTFRLNGVLETNNLVSGSVEEARVEADAGVDHITVFTNDGLFDDPGLSLRLRIDGGSDAARDRLAVFDDATDDLSIIYQAESDHAGTLVVGPANAEPFETEYTNVETVELFDEAGNLINSGSTTSRLVVFKHDPFEQNNDRFVATLIGANEQINIDPTINPGAVTHPFNNNFTFPGDQDWYQLEALVNGVLDVQVLFEEVATLASQRPGLPGNGNLNIEVYDVDGTLIAGNGTFGTNDGPGELDVDGDAFAENERVRMPVVAGQIYYLRVFGATDQAINSYNLTIINDAPPTPFDLELDDAPPNGATNPPGQADNSDTGRSQFDNVTYDNTPAIFLRLADGILLNDLPGNGTTDTPPDEVIAIPFDNVTANSNGIAAASAGYRVAIFDEANAQTPVGFAAQVAGQPGVYRFDAWPASLADGSHFVTAAVEINDPGVPTRQSGFGPRSAALEIVVDTNSGPLAFGAPTTAGDGLHADSDSGVAANPATQRDRITADATPTLWGTAEANAIVRVFVDVNLDGAVDAGDLQIGQTVAVPLDGTNQFPLGSWQLVSDIDLNDPTLFAARDGVRQLLVTSEDEAGNVNLPNDEQGVGSDPQQVLRIFLDTQGPQIVDPDGAGPQHAVRITDNPATARNEALYDLFDPKPSVDGPTPPVTSLTISVRDLPARTANDFLYRALEEAVAVDVGHYQVVGDHSGLIPIQSIVFTPDPDPPTNNAAATGILQLTFNAPLPDDRYTLTIADDVVDVAGNALDGETNTRQPQEIPEFPSGDGVPGGDFVARFTVDSRVELATFCCTGVYADINGNFVFDPEGQDNDFTNRDLVFNFGSTTDGIFAGNFSAAAAANASGFDKLGAYGLINGTYQFQLDLQGHDGVADFTSVSAFQINAIAVAGNFSAAHPGDEIGLFDGQRWYLDSDGDNLLELTDTIINSNQRGLPIVGDFNGDGLDDLATFDAGLNQFSFDLNRDGTADDTLAYGFPGLVERPVAGDLNLDGIDDLGLWVPGRQGQTPRETAEWFFLVSDQISATPSGVFNAYSPAPLGNDIFAQFGDDSALPLLANLDPPLTSAIDDLTPINVASPMDVNGDSFVTPADALAVINALNAPLRMLVVDAALDTNRDGTLGAFDALGVINYLNGLSLSANAEGETPANRATMIVGLAPARLNNEFVEFDVRPTTSENLDPSLGGIPLIVIPTQTDGLATRDPSPLARASKPATEEVADSLEASIEAIAQMVAARWHRL